MKPSSEGLTSGLLALGGQDPSAGGQLGYWLYSRRWTVLATDGWALPSDPREVLSGAYNYYYGMAR